MDEIALVAASTLQSADNRGNRGFRCTVSALQCGVGDRGKDTA